jgi:hypothetical protein
MRFLASSLPPPPENSLAAPEALPQTSAAPRQRTHSPPNASTVASDCRAAPRSERAPGWDAHRGEHWPLPRPSPRSQRCLPGGMVPCAAQNHAERVVQKALAQRHRYRPVVDTSDLHLRPRTASKQDDGGEEGDRAQMHEPGGVRPGLCNRRRAKPTRTAERRRGETRGPSTRGHGPRSMFGRRYSRLEPWKLNMGAGCIGHGSEERQGRYKGKVFASSAQAQTFTNLERTRSARSSFSRWLIGVPCDLRRHTKIRGNT